MEVIKKCPKCGESKNSSEYYRGKTKLGLASYCKSCLKKVNAKKYLENKVEHNLRSTAWQKNNREQALAIHRRWRLKNGPEEKEARLLRMYGIDFSEYNRMLMEQENKCPIMRHDFSTGRYGKNVDHDHKTGFVRGILCGKHNRSIGLFSDSAQELRSAATYLEQNNEWSRKWDNFEWSISTREHARLENGIS